MDSRLKEIIEDLKEEILDTMPGDFIDPPFVCLLSHKKHGWGLNVSAKDKDGNWYDPIKLMKKAVARDGWDDEEMRKGIAGVRSLLKHLERQYRKHKDASSPNAERLSSWTPPR